MLIAPQNMLTCKSCVHCVHYKTKLTKNDGKIKYDFPNCIAFPNGIPDEVYDYGHYEPRPDLGQKNDVVFEPDDEQIDNHKKLLAIDNDDPAFAEVN